ncbi:MAG TPA: phosphatase PAP2 family protein [Acidimicrobiia bacterium]|nr:phosphatase PAP2 family protein [Acidimicrobiia bacterium]
MLSVEVAPSRQTLMVAGGLVAACVALFTLIAEDLLDGGGLISHDEAVLTWFVDHRTDWMIHVAKVVSTIGSFVSLLIMGVVLGLWLLSRARRLAIAAAPVASLLLAGLVSTTVKGIFDRPRPPVTVHATSVGLAAFPSGHATDAAGYFLAAAFVLALTVARRPGSQLAWIALGLFMAALVGVSRLVLGVHWLSDVIAGWALGTAIAVTVVVVLWYASTAGHPRPASEEGSARAQ